LLNAFLVVSFVIGRNIVFIGEIKFNCTLFQRRECKLANDKTVPLMQTYYKPETEEQKHASTFMAFLMLIGFAAVSIFLTYTF